MASSLNSLAAKANKAFGNVKSPESALDLTLKEANEAESYGLSVENYAELIQRLKERHRAKWVREAREELRKEVWKELEPDMRMQLQPIVKKEVQDKAIGELSNRLVGELRPKIRIEVAKEVREEVRKDVEASFTAEQRQALLTKVQAELSREAPTTDERRAFCEYLRDAEIECLTLADSASKESEDYLRKRAWARRLRRPPFYAVLLSGFPALAYAYHQFGLDPRVSTIFWVALASIILFLVTLGTKNSRWDEHYTKLTLWYDSTSTKYRVLADKAKEARVVTARTANTKEALRDALDSFTEERRQLDSSYCPSSECLSKSRIEVRNQILTDVDPARIFDGEDRSQSIESAEVVDFEEKLAQSKTKATG